MLVESEDEIGKVTELDQQRVGSLFDSSKKISEIARKRSVTHSSEVRSVHSIDLMRQFRWMSYCLREVVRW